MIRIGLTEAQSVTVDLRTGAQITRSTEHSFGDRDNTLAIDTDKFGNIISVRFAAKRNAQVRQIIIHE